MSVFTEYFVPLYADTFFNETCLILHKNSANNGYG